MTNPEKEPTFKGTLIELNHIGGFGRETAEEIVGDLRKLAIDAEYCPANLGPEPDFIFIREELTPEIKSRLVDHPGVAYVWDDEGTKAWVEAVAILNNSTEPS